ncbi:MAG: SH3 domain-containing protein [Chloroflexi bacterium]|nr:SH3 domain-containing protein [Chloroflexota bacterium]
MLLIIVTAPSLTLADVPQQGSVSATTTGKMNIRSGPGTEWRWLGTVEAGQTVVLDGRNARADWVRGISPQGIVGWMFASYLNIPIEQVVALPIIAPDTPSQLGGSAPPANAPAENPAPAAPIEGGIPATITNGVNVRSDASTSAAKIGRLTYLTEVSANGRNARGDWVRVSFATGTGWVSAAYISLPPGEIMKLPIVEGGASVSGAPAAPAGAPAPPPVAHVAPVRGFNLGGHIAALSSSTVNALNRSGMTWIKRQVRWQGDDASVAWMVNEAHSMGYRILLGIVGMPGAVNEPGYFGRYAQFVARAAAEGADAIEIWNEQNIDREWAGGSISPASYTELLRQSYNAIKAVNPNTMVISGALAPTGYFGGCSGGGCDDNAYLAGMAAAGAANYMDCIGVHYNEGIIPPNQTSGDPRGNSGHYSRYFWGMVDTYYNAFGGARPLCFTELGYLSPEGFGGLPDAFAWAGGTSVAEQAAWLDSAVSLASSSGKVRLLIVWNVDFSNYGSDPMAGYAMIRPDGSCPACDALGR